MFVDKWLSAANLARAKALWDGGMSCPAIAKAIGDGCTANAIMNKKRKLGWNNRPDIGLWMTPDNLRLAEDMWLRGDPASDIAALIGGGCTKNAIVGWRRRTGLPARPSPIGHKVAATKPVHRQSRRRAVTLPPLVSLSHVMCAPPIVRLVPVAPPVPRPVLVEAFGPPVAPVVRSQCCWPVGEPGTRAFRYCDADVMDRGPYCASCRKRAFAKTAQPYVREAA